MNRYDQMVNKSLEKNKARSVFTITGVVIVTAFLFVCLQILLNFLDLFDAWSNDSMGPNRFAIYFFALIIYINTVIVVGIIKQSIMISSLDQLKNYGILRLLGATKKQISFLIFKATFLLECVGAMIGFVVGYVIYVFVRNAIVFDERHLSLKFRWEAVVYVLLVLLFDAFFSVRENVKLINQMTPLEAYRGTYRIQKEKRTKHIPFLFKAFGIEGQYAYKNVRRNPGRFFRSLWALTFGMAAMIGIFGTVSIIKNCLQKESGKYGYYGVYAYGFPFSYVDKDQYKEIFKNVTVSDGKLEGHSNGKPLYGTRIAMTDPFFIADSVKKLERLEFTASPTTNILIQATKKINKSTELDDEKPYEDLTESEQLNYAYLSLLADATLVGFDKEDIDREEEMLIDGTTKLSDQGILYVAGFNLYEESVEHYGFSSSENVIASDHKVGDQVTFFDPQILYERYLSLKEAYMDCDGFEYRFLDEWLIDKAKKELLEEGNVKTYTIEGVLSRDANCDIGLGFILSKDQYFALTGQGKDDFDGVMFHPTNDLKNINDIVGLHEYLKCDDDVFLNGTLIATSGYDPGIGSFLKLSYYGIGYAMIIYILNCINILNTSITNLQLRRSEFAQLKVLGTSQSGLRKIVLLEGFIISLFSAVGSIIIGLLLEWFLNENLISIMMPSKFCIPFCAIFTCFFVNFFFMCVCTYMPLKKSKVDLAEYLYENEE